MHASILRYAQILHPRETIPRLRGEVDKHRIVVNDTQIPPSAIRGNTFSSVSRAIDRAILVISDTDYIPAIRKARDNFTLVTLYHFDEPNFSRKLKYECDECLQITNDLIMKVKK